ncbi:MAG: hypothetical protein KME59_18690 [Trichormus sp. ATA11-4-KO1]|jgi:regulator of replication initiation timing|nr:hypothetical protein [Trichormus sp. ATA11-4-KO1]
MSDRETVLELVKRLPENVTLREILRKIEFIAAVKSLRSNSKLKMQNSKLKRLMGAKQFKIINSKFKIISSSFCILHFAFLIPVGDSPLI